ncbi:MAG TPA: sensor histidine kinase [Maribacter sp.]|uniref:histidine kinase n=1 Tax=Maribacter dokdonensis TaxID=320912 RepID=A0A1H4PUF9_9FLAO|nr:MULTISPECIES: HAMP domain-containing sensor histidine kinase [Maribacter]HAF78375.1 sensor histidine kinase [Maribacter sp.]KSA14468.1 sensory box sensor histidine kinase [Maribacter dokdonensis DSW-8]MDP2526852.1 HAMP domain-containing sensor histidine kinase [Maribacter dokdonensis]SDS81396.1 Signal transduction histidine kinase [Maribacter dokdonensis]SEC11009.1 Signal transduction histidine kinase [Maribacter dokdonensis]|tara:strand:- start:81347 stop:82435 length:1089 start_codon:yes stop_codon:yes gene_type:complete
MTSAEAKLKERVKELTCLYEVTSIIVNADYDQIDASLEAIVYCLKRAWQFEQVTEVFLKVGEYTVQTDDFKPNMVCLSSKIKVFNKLEGEVMVGYPSEKYSIDDFLIEEQTLLNNVALDVGNLIERKQIRDSEALTRRKMERTDRLHILGEITAGIAHELNTPLANILGFAELLTDKMTDKQSVRDLEKIMDSAIFSREIVKKLMFFACEMPQEMKRVQLIPIVTSVIKLLAPSLRDKKIKLVTTYENEDLVLQADTVQLTQVLFNLIMNAIYYSPENGIISVKVLDTENHILLKIADQGEGIPKELEDKVFEPFFTTKPIGEGTGLGLSVVHGIITSHKGTIEHEQNTPKGTIFTVNFPKL